MDSSKSTEVELSKNNILQYIKNLISTFIEDKAKNLIKIQKRNSNTKMNLIKTYAIIAVVCSHCNGGGVVFPMENWISPFFYFMPIFVFVSGYFYKKENDDANLFIFIIQKIKKLLVPYFLWNVFYGILNNIFRKIGVIKYGDPIDFHSLFIRPWIDGHQFHFNIAAWFLLSLFLVTITTYLLRRIMKLIKILNEEFLLLITFVVSVVSIYYAQKGYNTGWYLCLAKFCFLLPYYQLGFLYKKYEKYFNKHNFAMICIMTCGIYMLLVLSKGEASLGVVFAIFNGNPLILTGLEVLAILITATVFEILSPAFEKSKIVKTIGENTFTIMMHHAIIIFLMNLILYIMTGFIDIASFDIQEFQSTLWYVCPWRDSRIYIFYVAFSVAIPLIIKLICNNIIIKTNNSLKNKE